MHRIRAFTGTLLTIFLILYSTKEASGNAWPKEKTALTSNNLHVNYRRARQSTTNYEKFIIDTDAGGDDASAIALALEAERQEMSNMKVIAITCIFGNTDVEQVTINVAKILTVANRSDIPIYVGAAKGLIKTYKSSDWFGKDGFGDAPFDLEIQAQIDRSRHSSVAMVELVRQHPGEISIVLLGPLTNVALAMTLDPNFAKNVKRIYVLGSSADENRKPGDYVDFNFYQDPHGDFILFSTTTSSPILVFPRKISKDAAVPAAWRKNTLGSKKTAMMDFLNKVEETGLNKSRTWNVGDVALIASIIQPTLITDSYISNLTPVYEEDPGAVIVDSRKSHNAEIVKTFNIEGFKNFLLIIFSDTGASPA